MPRITLSGLAIDHELIGDAGAPAVALTPGGRFARDVPGLRELALTLAARGRRVLLWDRPNCGASDVAFTGASESDLQAAALVELIGALDLGPTAIGGGSAGARVSMLAAARAPDAISHLMLWWVTGGSLMMIALAANNCSRLALTASLRGMAAVADLPDWAEQVARNPATRARIAGQDPAAFIAAMERWAEAYLPSPEAPVAGLSAAAVARLAMPVLIVRNGASDLTHPRAVTDRLAAALPHARHVDPPWPDSEWNDRFAAAQGGGTGHYVSWPLLAPQLLDFLEAPRR